MTISPAIHPDKDTDPTLGRLILHKEFHGDLEGTSEGQMLTAGSPESGSAGYVAMERFTGTLDGLGGKKKGTFCLQHSGTMNRGKPSLSVTVVPDSGTDELTGISGDLEIIIEDGKHSYNFNHSL